MIGTILLIILVILCVLLLLPLRLKASFGDGKWAVTLYYVFIRLYHKESAEKPKPETPPKPGDLPDDTLPPQPEPKPETESKPPAAAEAAPKPETVTEAHKPDSKPDKPESKPEKPDPEPVSEETPEPDEPSEEPPKKKKRSFLQRLKPHSLSEAFGLAKDALAALSPALKFLTRHLHFRHIRLYLAVASDDPANTATLYGKICACAYNLLAALQCWVDFEADEFRILADFYHDSVTFRASGELRVSPMAAILLLLILGIKFLWYTLRRFRREDKEAARKAEETAPVTT